MKIFAKTAAIIVSLVLVLGSCFGVSKNYSFASEQSTKTYLVPANFTISPYNISDGNGGYVNQYNLYKTQERTATRPFDVTANAMMPGASFTLLVDNNNQGNVTCNVANSVTFGTTDSVVFYIYFSDVLTHNLKVTLYDQNLSAVYWNISASQINEQISSKDGMAASRKGWVMLELPAEDISGFTGCNSLAEVGQIETITFDYSTANLTEQEDYNGSKYYAYCNIYAPYIAESSANKIKFSGHQPYYNISAKVGEDLNKFCEGEKLKIGTVPSMLNYCIVGEQDLLALGHSPNPEDYTFTLRIGTASDLSDYKEYSLSFEDISTSRNHEFKDAGTYRATVIVNDIKAGLSGSSSVAITVNPFVAVRLSSNPVKLTNDATYNYTIYLGDAVTSLQDLSVTSSDAKVASAQILDNGVLQITTVGNGNANITLSGKAKTIHGTAATDFSKTYNIKVSSPMTTNWVAISFGCVGIVAAAIVVYLIMRKRRLIKGVYPKY